MRDYYIKKENGYISSIQKGLSAVRSFRGGLSYGRGSREINIQQLKRELDGAEDIVIGAGAGLSTAAGFTYSGERFEEWFSDFRKAYGFRDMYSGGFYPFPEKEIFWAYWARYIYINRFLDAPKTAYQDLYALVKDKDYFVITTNVDHCFQKAGFDKERLFYTQGDYGLFQSVNPKIRKTYDNQEWVAQAMEAQGFMRNEGSVFETPADGKVSMRLPTELIPKCPDDGSDMTMNLRSDDSFVEDAGWQEASARYAAFLKTVEGRHVLFLEIGVGANTPVIIKYPFWAMTAENPKAVYACLNYNEAICPKQIEDQSICIDGDSGEVIRQLL